MAKVIRTYVREDGHTIDVYESGAERDRDTGRLTSPARHTLITTENTTEYHRARVEKTKELTRAAIVEEMNSGLLPAGTPRITESSEAVAVANAMLWSQVVMNSEAYPRDRLAQLEFTARLTGDIPDPRQPADPAPDREAARLAALAGVANVEAARIMAKVLADVLRLQQSNQVPADVIDG